MLAILILLTFNFHPGSPWWDRLFATPKPISGIFKFWERRPTTPHPIATHGPPTPSTAHWTHLPPAFTPPHSSTTTTPATTTKDNLTEPATTTTTTTPEPVTTEPVPTLPPPNITLGKDLIDVIEKIPSRWKRTAVVVTF